VVDNAPPKLHEEIQNLRASIAPVGVTVYQQPILVVGDPEEEPQKEAVVEQ
jgi:hypothetical protein